MYNTIKIIAATPLVASLLFSSISFAQEIVPKSNQTVAVIALLHGNKDKDAAGMAKVLNKTLQERMNVIKTEEVFKRLQGEGEGNGNINKLKVIFKRGYKQSYSFKYKKAVKAMEQVLYGIKSVPSSKEKWNLFEQANIYRGIALVGLKKQDKAISSFLAVLKVRKDFALSAKDYSPKIIKVFEKARKRLKDLNLGMLTVKTDLPGSTVFLDGVEIGTTPLNEHIPHGGYYLEAKHMAAGSVGRSIVISNSPEKVIIEHKFENSLDLSHEHPAIRVQEIGQKIPKDWWRLMGKRVGAKYLVAVRKDKINDKSKWVASLVDTDAKGVLYEGSIDSRGMAQSDMLADAEELTIFLSTGKESDRVIMQCFTMEASTDGMNMRSVPVISEIMRPRRERPMVRTWWPWAIGAAAALGGGVTANLFANDYHANAVTQSKKDLANTMTGVSIAGYTLSAALLVTGILLHFTFDDYDIGSVSEQAFLPALGNNSIGFSFLGRF